MDITKRSTSPLMDIIFGNDVNIIKNRYNNHIESISKEHPTIKGVFNECVNRTGFLFSYMSVEYGYYSVTGNFLPEEIKDSVIGFGLIGLAVSIDDDIVDEYSHDKLKMMKNVSVSELIQNYAYDLIFHNNNPKSSIVIDEIKETMKDVVKYQVLDMQNIEKFKRYGFNSKDYLVGTFKTVCPVKYGFRLGIKLSMHDYDKIETSDNLSECLGTCMQLFDDILDLENDIKNYSYDVTLPMHMYTKTGNLDFVFQLIVGILDEGEKLKAIFPYHDRIESMIKGYRCAMMLIERKIYEKPVAVMA